MLEEEIELLEPFLAPRGNLLLLQLHLCRVLIAHLILHHLGTGGGGLDLGFDLLK